MKEAFPNGDIVTDDVAGIPGLPKVYRVTVVGYDTTGNGRFTSTLVLFESTDYDEVERVAEAVTKIIDDAADS